ncbi:hypothetical protein BB427_02010 [Pseudoalteromonas sp. BMB]|uniref:polysaccharide pyruvyl transferase family protein n=1 Tax=Pseudoalteromonas sp. BMB TaxID=1874619 RepID=UPI00083E2AE9|nr:polysaccharide pyruvyl transferase family protein [Pseudoalteromonas sp. BMB]ODB36812.1 hypothetical protein BB427_02010 [Pseudoalteromonas sp. BMB]
MIVGIVGVGHSTNIGDQLIAKCLAESILKFNYVEKVLFYDLSKGQYDIEFKHPLGLNIPLKGAKEKKRNHSIRFLKTLFLEKFNPSVSDNDLNKFIETCDSFVIGGGHLLIDNFGVFGSKLTRVIKMILEKDKKCFFWSVGVGDIHSYLYNFFFLKTLKRVPVYTRDKNSFLNAKNLGLDVKGVVHDCAFTSAKLIETSNNIESCLTLFIMDPNESSRHSNLTIDREEAKRWWLCLIEFFATKYKCINIANNGSSNDYFFIKEYIEPYANLNGKDCKINILDRSLSYHDILNVISISDHIVAQRLHAIVPSICYDKKVVAIKWDVKVENILSDANLSNILIDFSTLPSEVYNRLKNYNEQPRVNLEEYNKILIQNLKDMK